MFPKSLYYMNPDGINLTVQAATAEIVESFNKLSTDGIKLRTFPSMGNELVLWNEFSNAFKKGLLYLPSKKRYQPFSPNQVGRLKLFVMGFRGDWKSYVQVFNLVRHPGTDEVR